MAQTPVGVFKFCHLNKPDTKFNAAGEFNVSVVLDGEDAAVKRMLATLEKAHAKAVAAGEEGWAEIPAATKRKMAAKGVKELTALPFYEDEYDENDQPTGNIIMRFKTKAAFEDRKTGVMTEKVIPFIDGKGQVIPNNKRPLVYGGTTGRVDFTDRPYFIPAQGTCGLSMYLNKVQIAKLVSSGGGGFDALDDSDFDGSELEERTDTGGGQRGGSDDSLDDDLDGDLGGNDQDGAGDDDDLDSEIPF